ncbi:MAG: helix-turn-helix transcriptional regulator [Candidatus Micrarchaeaceae archaeon]
MFTNGKFLTETEVSERTHISLGTLRRWRLESRGPHYYKFGSLVRYAESDLDVWLAAQPGGGGIQDRKQPATAAARSLLRKSG